jgi:hypothetical protein
MLSADLLQFLSTALRLKLALLLKHFEFMLTLVLAVKELQHFRGKAEQAPKDRPEKATAKDVKHVVS